MQNFNIKFSLKHPPLDVVIFLEYYSYAEKKHINWLYVGKWLVTSNQSHNISNQYYTKISLVYNIGSCFKICFTTTLHWQLTLKRQETRKNCKILEEYRKISKEDSKELVNGGSVVTKEDKCDQGSRFTFCPRRKTGSVRLYSDDVAGLYLTSFLSENGTLWNIIIKKIWFSGYGRIFMLRMQWVWTPELHSSLFQINWFHKLYWCSKWLKISTGDQISNVMNKWSF